MTDKISEAFCVLPWIHSYFGTDGLAGLCCISPDPIMSPDGGMGIQRHSLQEIIHSPAMDETRRQLLEGKKIKACTACWDAERISGSSLRTYYNEIWQRKMPSLMSRIIERREGRFRQATLGRHPVRQPLQPALSDMQRSQQHPDRTRCGAIQVERRGVASH